MKILILFSLLLLAGCVTKNPAWTGPNTNGIPQYVTDTDRLNAASNSVAGVSGALRPVNPWGGLTDYAVNTGFGLAALISGLIAKRKNAQAKSAEAAADTIAAGAVKAGPTAVNIILQHAAETSHFASVADLVNSNTGANQTTTGAPTPPGS